MKEQGYFLMTKRQKREAAVAHAELTAKEINRVYGYYASLFPEIFSWTTIPAEVVNDPKHFGDWVGVQMATYKGYLLFCAEENFGAYVARTMDDPKIRYYVGDVVVRTKVTLTSLYLHGLAKEAIKIAKSYGEGSPIPDDFETVTTTRALMVMPPDNDIILAALRHYQRSIEAAGSDATIYVGDFDEIARFTVDVPVTSEHVGEILTRVLGADS